MAWGEQGGPGAQEEEQGRLLLGKYGRFLENAVAEFRPANLTTNDAATGDLACDRDMNERRVVDIKAITTIKICMFVLEMVLKALF